MNTNLLITGGAGFIGSNLAYFFSKKGYRVTIFDNFVRAGTTENAVWLKKNNPRIKVVKGDIRKVQDVKKAVDRQDIIFHLAAQVAVTTSVSHPQEDFEINAWGTLNLLESVRLTGRRPIIIFSSTNKVYGCLESVKITQKNNQYCYLDFPFGISEKMNLDFHSPYGCSKGAADQYIRDYYRIFNIPTVVFRQSCIYGPRQFGMEDQGWVAWFIIATLLGKQITVYGDGKQVRDVLYIDDLVRLFELAVGKINIARGKIYNIGGGYKNTLSVWTQFGPLLEKLFAKKIPVKFDDWRPGDQKVYVSDIGMVKKELGWEPMVTVEEGVRSLYTWCSANKKLFTKIKY